MPFVNQAIKLKLLQIIQTAAQELALPVPSFIIGNTDPQVIQLLALANREGRTFSVLPNQYGGWQELRGEFLFDTAGVGDLTGNVTSGSAIITNISSTADLLADWVIEGDGIPRATTIVSVDSATQVTIRTEATATATGVLLSAGQQQYDLPSDFGYFMTKTFWDRSFRWQLLGPLEAQEWQVLKSGISPVGPRTRFRIMNNQFYLDPVPTSVHNLVFEYYSNGWCQSASGTPQTVWTADTDYYTLDDDAMIQGVMWRYRAAKRFSYDVEKRNYDMYIERLLARNGGNRDIPLNATASGINFLGQQNIPDTGFGR